MFVEYGNASLEPRPAGAFFYSSALNSVVALQRPKLSASASIAARAGAEY
jgi:hypothetical protein